MKISISGAKPAGTVADRAKVDPKSAQIAKQVTATPNPIQKTNGKIVFGKSPVQNSQPGAPHSAVNSAARPISTSGPVESAAQKSGSVSVQSSGTPTPSLPPVSLKIDAAAFQHHSQPDVMSPQSAENFKQQLELLSSSFENKDMVAAVLRRILGDLNEHPEFEEFLAPEHCGMMIRALRVNYNNMVQVKAAKKKGSRKKKEAPVSSIDLSDLQNLLMS